MLDYRNCGAAGEPSVVHVDQERDYKVTPLARTFEAFVRGLVNEKVYDRSAEDRLEALAKVDTGRFSSLLAGLIDRCPRAGLGPVLRRVCRRLVEAKGHFSLHDDPTSVLMYDLQFYLYSASNPVPGKDAYLKAYEAILTFGDGQFSTGGYAPDFVKTWIEGRLSHGEIVASKAGGLMFSEAFRKRLEAAIDAEERG